MRADQIDEYIRKTIHEEIARNLKFESWRDENEAKIRILYDKEVLDVIGFSIDSELDDGK